MASEVRVNQIQNRSGLGTVTVTDTGITVAGVTTFLGNVNVSVGNSITVSNKFISSSGVGLGQTTTTGRNAGVGTAAGTVIYNSTKGVIEYYNQTSWVEVAKGTITATGGTKTTISGYIVHTFTTSDTFVVNSGLADVEVLIVAGGGGAGGGQLGCHGGGGGGGGGVVRHASYTLTPGAYPIVVGGGGGGQNSCSSGSSGGNGGNSSAFGMTAIGGGGGGATLTANGNAGGSGGGASRDNSGNAGGPGTQPSQNSPFTPNPNFSQFGNPGGGTGPSTSAAGGGGAGGAGAPGSGPLNGDPSSTGGFGLQFTQFGPSTYYGGGGGTSGITNRGQTATGTNGAANTGAGGGGNSGGNYKGNGGTGVVLIKYTN